MSEVDMQVERGEVPERVIAAKPDSKEPFSRPLCAWPKTAHYNGSGSTNDAANSPARRCVERAAEHDEALGNVV